MEISSKYKRYEKNANQKLISKFENSWIDRLFQMDYLDLFKLYYNNLKPLNKLIFEDKKIILSPKTKSFYYLLETSKNKNLRKNLIETTKSVYLNDNESNRHPFETPII